MREGGEKDLEGKDSETRILRFKGKEGKKENLEDAWREKKKKNREPSVVDPF